MVSSLGPCVKECQNVISPSSSFTSDTVFDDVAVDTSFLELPLSACPDDVGQSEVVRRKALKTGLSQKILT